MSTVHDTPDSPKPLSGRTALITGAPRSNLVRPGKSVPAVRVEGAVKRSGATVALDGAGLEIPADQLSREAAARPLV